jgi:hypothetical protein
MSKKYDQEILLLLQIVKGQAGFTSPDSPINTNRLIKLAEMHRVVYQVLLFAQQYNDIFTGEQIAKLEKRCRQGALRSLAQLHELKRIAVALNEKGIGYVCIKGPQLSRMVYGREALKESMDLDIMLVHEANLAEIHAILSGLGYAQSNLNNYKGQFARKIFLIAKREVHYFNRETRCAIDLHIRPGANTYLTDKYFRSFFSNLQTTDLEGTAIKVLSDEAYLVYLCYHGSLHQFSRLAWLLDIRAFLALKRDLLDYKKLMSFALTLHVERSVYLTILLLQRYFGDNIPLHVQERPDFTSLLEPSKRMHYLVAVCADMPGRDAMYRMTFRGRTEKVVYIMLLIKGIAGKIDWFYGIFMRFVVKRIIR